MSQWGFDNPLVWYLGLPTVLGVGVLAVRNLRRQGRSRRQICVLISLRALMGLMLLYWLARPVSRMFTSDERDSSVIVLVDRSESMSLEEIGRSRYQQVLELLRERLVPAAEKVELRLKPFLFAGELQAADGPMLARSQPDGQHTNLGRAITESLSLQERPPLAVLALTDGVVTDSQDNPRAVSMLVRQGVPFYGVGVGSETDAQFLELEQVTAPGVVAPRNRFRISARLKATGEQPIPKCELSLLRDGQFVERKAVSQGPGPRLWQESFTVSEPDSGTHTYTVRLTHSAAEAITLGNTESSARVRVTDERALKVLFLQGGLTWDYKFIRLALRGDPAIRLSGLSRTASHSSFMQTVDDGPDALRKFPDAIEELAEYRVVILANIRPRDLSDGQQQMLKQFCGRFGGGLLLLGGQRTFDSTWRESSLEELLPVKLGASPAVTGPISPFRLVITDAARQSGVFQISDAGDNAAAWRQLPTFNHCATVQSVKPGAEVWMRRDPVVSGQLPALMITQRFGTGLTSVIGLQNLWRWRLAKRAQIEHFDRFWRQLIRHLAKGNRRSVEIHLPDQALSPAADIRLQVQLTPDPSRPTDSQHELRLRVRDQQGNAILDEALVVRPDRPHEVAFHAADGGLYTVSVADSGGTIQATRVVEVRDVTREFQTTARNLEGLTQWAHVSQGQAMAIEDCGDLEQLLVRLKQPVDDPADDRSRMRPAGPGGWFLSLMLTLLSLEWMARKSWGLS